jgi:fucose permease
VLSGVFGLPFLGLRTGLLVLAPGAALLALGAGWPLTLLGGFVAGFGFGLLTTSVNRAFLGGFGPRSAGMVGLVNAVYGIGAILSPLLFLALGARPALAFAALVLLAALALALSEKDAAPPTRGLPDLRDPRLLVTLFIGGNGLIEGISVGFGASALTDAGLQPESAARTASAFFLAYVAARLALTWIAGRIAPARLLTLGFAGTGLAMAVAALGLPAPGYILAGAFVGMIFPSYYVWASRILGPDPRMTAAILTVALTGGTLAPLALRPVLAVTGESGVFAVVAVVALLMATLFALLRRRAEALAPRTAP